MKLSSFLPPNGKSVAIVSSIAVLAIIYVQSSRSQVDGVPVPPDGVDTVLGAISLVISVYLLIYGILTIAEAEKLLRQEVG
jgi:hypothetical protein